MPDPPAIVLQLFFPLLLSPISISSPLLRLIVNLGSIPRSILVRWFVRMRKFSKSNVLEGGIDLGLLSPPRLGRKPRASGGKVKRSIFT